MPAHALLSPSAAHRWLHCTPSAVLASKVEDKGSTYAEEGTCAHALCEMLLLQALGRPYEQAEKEYEELAVKWASTEMTEAAELYQSIVLEKWDKAQKVDAYAQIYVERRLDFTNYAPESFGTADCVILADGRMEVIDFKYGNGVEVSAQNNPQMMIYALGAYEEFVIGYDIREVCMTIVQPRLGNVDAFVLPVDQLLTWGNDVLKPAADAAFTGAGELCPGDHCRFCPVKATCSALAYQAIDCYRRNTKADLLPMTVLAEVLKLIPAIENWASSVKDYALAQALEGSVPEGFKVVEGRSTRVITDEAALAEQLTQEGISAEAIYKPREIQTITALEKLVGKKRFSELASPYITKPAGKPTLVPITYKRKAIDIDPVEAAKRDFTNFT